MVYRSQKCTQVFGWDLDYFQTKEWLDVQDKLDELEQQRVLYNPARDDLFRALHLCSYSDCNVAWIGQDPYPDPKHATGIAFSVPKGSSTASFAGQMHLGDGSREGKDMQRSSNGGRNPLLPMSLQTIFQELVSDLGCDYPDHGCLEDWCRQGVLLWNATPTCVAGQPGSHYCWPEWHPLTQEIIERLSAKGKVIFVFVGNKARRYEEYVDPYNNKIICVSHPSPRGQISAKSKFIGSRLFSTINAHLIHYLKEPMVWDI